MSGEPSMGEDVSGVLHETVPSVSSGLVDPLQSYVRKQFTRCRLLLFPELVPLLLARFASEVF
jgi:hypothetical protein